MCKLSYRAGGSQISDFGIAYSGLMTNMRKGECLEYGIHTRLVKCQKNGFYSIQI